MTETLYLIAHKVRGEATFDVAIKMDCEHCRVQENSDGEMVGPQCGPQEDCEYCKTLGFWWIIPTSGHRAYPWWSIKLEDIDDTVELNFDAAQMHWTWPGPMPTTLRDHYEAKPDKVKPLHDNKPSLAHTLGLIKPFNRRL